MNIEEIREYALSFPEVTEGFPFGETVLVFKKKNKMFLLLPLDEEITQFNVKCDPEKAIELRDQIKILEDNKQKISELKIKLKEAISQQDFETAIKLRDELKSFE